jgi:hypothetical protein
MALIDNKAYWIEKSKEQVAAFAVKNPLVVIAAIETCEVSDNTNAAKILSYLFRAANLSQYPLP